MSILNSLLQHNIKPPAPVSTGEGNDQIKSIDQQSIIDVLDKVQQLIAPVWPLKDYVAVNPYMGFADQKFLDTRNYLRTLSDLEMLMGVDYYRQQFDAGEFGKADVDAAVDELVADGVVGAERIDVNQVISFLKEPAEPSPTSDAKFTKPVDPNRQLWTLSESMDRHTDSNWSRLINEEISRHCAAHYDEGQAAWTSPWKNLPLFQAWRSAAQHDRRLEILGIDGFREFVANLPHEPQAALVFLLGRLGVPTNLWADFLLCQALAVPGWSAWTRYNHRQAEQSGEENTDFVGLLAIRLAYEVAVSTRLGFQVDWASVAKLHGSLGKHDQPTDKDLLRYALLIASEISFRNRLVGQISAQNESETETNRRLAQMVFCIDVRSERFRRQLETCSSDIETYGFAGFFGLPLEFVALGEEEGTSQVPVLISPQFTVHEHLESCNHHGTEETLSRRSTLRFLRKTWKQFQSSAVSMFAFVETAGLFYGYKLLARTFGKGQDPVSRHDGVHHDDCSQLSPSLDGLAEQGIDATKQADMAESVLRGIGIVDNFARLVVFCGHGSKVENNPLKAGLDCGACGGHAGEPNARFAAKLLNEPAIREALIERGIEIPTDTQFVAAQHNTTTDKIEFFDLMLLPESHKADLQQLKTLASVASKQTNLERLEFLPGDGIEDLERRSQDWSEVRPEWGLAGNAAFIAAPRDITKGFSLNGRSFLHSYDYRKDEGFAVLEQIMTAPMVVANWINMQYYASTVDPIHFGSGNKTVHNVVGRFGILSGNSGDLMTGLPWQSVHDGGHYQHYPMRLQVVIAAPRDAIENVVAKHPSVSDLLKNGWLHLTVIDDGNSYRYTEQQQWEQLCPNSVETVA